MRRLASTLLRKLAREMNINVAGIIVAHGMHFPASLAGFKH